MSTRNTKVRAAKGEDVLATSQARDEIVVRAIASGRIARSELSRYRQKLDRDPEGTLKVLASLSPVPLLASSKGTAVEDLIWPGPPVRVGRGEDDERRPEADAGWGGFTASARSAGLL